MDRLDANAACFFTGAAHLLLAERSESPRQLARGTDLLVLHASGLPELITGAAARVVLGKPAAAGQSIPPGVLPASRDPQTVAVGPPSLQKLVARLEAVFGKPRKR